jgi:hypothetical protein
MARTLGRDSPSEIPAQVGVAHGQHQPDRQGPVIRHLEEAEVIVSTTPASYQRHYMAFQDRTQPPS